MAYKRVGRRNQCVIGRLCLFENYELKKGGGGRGEGEGERGAKEFGVE